MDKAPISKQGDHQMGRQERLDLLQHRVLVLKRNFGTRLVDG